MLTTIQNRRARCMPLCLQVIASFIVYVLPAWSIDSEPVVTPSKTHLRRTTDNGCRGMAVFEECHSNVSLTDLEDDAEFFPILPVCTHPQKLSGLEGSHGR